MSNYTIENLIPAIAGEGRVPAIKIGNQVFPMVSGGGGSTDFYKCATVDTSNSTWTGYKAVFDAVTGTYSFEATATSGLTYSVITPVVGKVYADGALIEAKLYEGMPSDYVFYAPLSASSATAETGQTLTVTGSPVFSSYLGIPSAEFSGSEVIEAANTNIPYSENPYSVSLWINVAQTPSNDEGVLAIGYDDSGALMAVIAKSSGITLSGHGPGYGWDAVTPAQVTFNGTWKHVAIVFWQGSGGNRTAYLYIDGALTQSGTFVYDEGAYGIRTPRFFIGSYWGDGSYMSNFTGRMAAVRVYDHALSSAEIAQLAAEFTPGA